MAFIQIIEANTSKWDEMQALVTEYEKSIDGKSTVRRSIVTRDRANPERHIIIVFFDSYESAMINSNLPETAAFGEKQAALLSAPMAFTDLDVVEDRSHT